jgi:hypothetical protein
MRTMIPDSEKGAVDIEDAYRTIRNLNNDRAAPREVGQFADDSSHF